MVIWEFLNECWFNFFNFFIFIVVFIMLVFIFIRFIFLIFLYLRIFCKVKLFLLFRIRMWWGCKEVVKIGCIRVLWYVCLFNELNCSCLFKYIWIFDVLISWIFWIWFFWWNKMLCWFDKSCFRLMWFELFLWLRRWVFLVCWWFFVGVLVYWILWEIEYIIVFFEVNCFSNV